MPKHGNDAALIAAAVAGRRLQEIASAAGVSISTAQRRLREPDTIRAINEGRNELRRTTLGRLLELRTVALTRIGDALEADDIRLVLRAAGLVLSATSKAEVAYDLHERLAAVEDAQQRNAETSPVDQDSPPDPGATPRAQEA